MKKFIALLNCQIKILFISPSTYASAFLFVLLMGVVYLLMLQEASGAVGATNPMNLFLSFFWFPVLFMVPMLTMRSLAEERRMGTLQALMTTSLTPFQIVFAKFLACYFLYVLFWVLTLFFPILTYLTLPETAIDDRVFSISGICLSYVFIFVSGLMYIAIGLLASSLTRSTLVAGMLSFCMLFIAIVGGSLSNSILDLYPALEPNFGGFIAYLQSFTHLEDFGNSLLDTRPFFLYISSAAAFVGITSLVTEYKAS